MVLPENVGLTLSAICVCLLTWRALYLVYMVVVIVLGEMSGTGSRRALNSPLQLLRTSLVVVGILFVCDNLGFQVKSLIAGISIAGLCSQALLQDAFAFIALTVESPFQVGDVVMVKGQERGFVESVGLRTTILRSVTGNLQVYANKDIAAARVENWSRIPWRRIAENVELDPFTEPERLAQLLPMLKKILETEKQVVQSYTDVTVNGFTEWGISTTFYYKYEPGLVEGKTYSVGEYAALKSRVVGKLLAEFKSKGIRTAQQRRVLALERGAAAGK